MRIVNSSLYIYIYMRNNKNADALFIMYFIIISTLNNNTLNLN